MKKKEEEGRRGAREGGALLLGGRMRQGCWEGACGTAAGAGARLPGWDASCFSLQACTWAVLPLCQPL